MDEEFAKFFIKDVQSAILQNVLDVPPLPRQFQGNLDITMTETKFVYALNYMKQLFTAFTIFNIRKKKTELIVHSRQHGIILCALTLCTMSAFGCDDEKFSYGYIPDIHNKMKVVGAKIEECICDIEDSGPHTYENMLCEKDNVTFETE